MIRRIPFILAPLLASFLAAGAAAEPDYLSLVRRCADVLIEKGRDRYGAVHSPLFMSVLDVDTLESPADAPLLDGMVRTEGRLHRRNLRGADLYEDQSLIRVLLLLTEKTGDPKYAAAAREAAAYFLEHCRKPSTGLLTWGTHIFWDCYADAPGGDQDGVGPHEMLLREPLWEFLWEVSPERTRAEIELIWDWHIVDKETGLHNRHDDRARGCDFAFSGAEFIYAFAFLAKKSGDPVWRDRAHLVANWHLERAKQRDRTRARRAGNSRPLRRQILHDDASRPACLAPSPRFYDDRR